MGMDGWLRLGAVVLIAFGTTACSDDDDASGGSGGGSADAGPVGGTGGDTGGTGGINTGTGGTGGATGGTGGTPTSGMGAMVMCDSTVPTTATCGGTACAPPSQFAPACTVPCCATGDVCGYLAAQMDNVGSCVAAPVEDPDCPDLETGFGVLQGCCQSGNTCGFISGSMNACVITHPVIPEVAEQAGAACDGSDNDGGVAPVDAGTDAG